MTTPIEMTCLIAGGGGRLLELAGLGYTLGHSAVVAAKTVSHYSLWFTIGIVVLTVLVALRSQRRPVAAPDGQQGS